ncbi:hypothetical protein COX85_01155 [Candidatus Micrarchaeota archaeon CG_4_10_14_0_2_um_filter_55_9]|nr:MAG: hypothetical protein COT57_01780 [Candidatus Micrarchaeota archaeon CG09_land_8_20_14_0_10_55_25]PIZ91959.1 MAG: hypothetical protein COX85_01155 [Candidatus Micrarchaeota archaeon CG_4_10_14_0_2_um_filter_55_9]PJD00824.1 MAG: hypothetical protein COU38_04340 [Candidatus Micrarchaeota archaeon CG10_big_fil_rev_8_21_14_0_10_54_18]
MVKTVDREEREQTEWKYMGLFIQILVLAFILSVLGFGISVGILGAVAIILVLRVGFLNGVQYDAKAAPDKFK